MKKFLKYFFIILGAFVTIFIFLNIVLILIFDPSKYKSNIEQFVYEKSGRPFEIKGDIKWEIYPLFSLSIGDVVLKNNPEFDNKTFSDIKAINVSLDLLRVIFKREVVIKDFFVDEPGIYLKVLKSGRNNWQDFLDTKKSINKEDRYNKNLDDKGLKKPVTREWQILVDNIKIKKAKFIFDNEKQNKHIKLLDTDIAINNSGGDTKTKYNINSNISVDEKIKCFLKANGSLKIDSQEKIITITDNSINISDFIFDGNKIEPVTVDFAGNIDSGKKIIKMDRFSLKSETLGISGVLTVEGFDKSPLIRGNANLDVKNVFGSDSLKLNGELGYKNKVLNFTDLKLNTGDITISGKISCNFNDPVEIIYSLSSDKIDINKIIEKISTDKNKIKKSAKKTDSNNTVSGDNGFKISKVKLKGDISAKELLYKNFILKDLFIESLLNKSEIKNKLSFKYKGSRAVLDTSIPDVMQKKVIISLNFDKFDIEDVAKKAGLNVKSLDNISLRLNISDNKNTLEFNNISLKSFINARIPFNFASNITYDKKYTSLKIDNIGFTINNSKINGIVQAKTVLLPGNFNGSLQAILYLEDVNALFVKPLFTDTSLINKVDINADYTFDVPSKVYDMKKLKLNFNKSKLDGNVSIIRQDTIKVNSHLKANYIDTGEILPLFTKKEINKDVNVDSKNTVKDGNFRGKDKINIIADISIDQLKLFKINVDKALIHIDGNDNKYNLLAKAGLYKGNFDGNIFADTSGREPAFDVKGDIEDAEISLLLKDLYNNTPFSGRTKIECDIKAAGADRDALIRSLNGTAHIAVKKGAFKGLNLGLIIKNIFSLIEKREFSSFYEESLEDFTGLNADLRIEKGIIKNDNLVMNSPVFNINGAGQVDLVKNYIDYGINLVLLKPVYKVNKDNLTGSDNNSIIFEELAGRTLPVRYKGPLNKPFQEIDYKKFIGDKFKSNIIKEIKPYKKEIKKGMEKFIKNLF